MIAGELSARREEPTDLHYPTELVEHVAALEPQVLVLAATRPI